MEILVLIVVAGLIYFYVSNNSRKVKDETVITTTQTVKTDHGEQTITRTTKINDVQMDIRNPQTPMTFREHQIAQPQPTRQEQYTHTLEHTTNRLADTTPEKTQQKQEIQLKLCSHCNRTQPITEFRPNQKRPDGLTKWCKSCMDTSVDISGKKVCEKCKQTRLKSSFYLTSKYPDGLSKWCKYCLPQKKKR